MHALLAAFALLPGLRAQQPDQVPRLWDEAALADWATPLAGLGVAPTQIRSELYYQAPVDNLRTYPVYHPDREPKGYREALLQRGPQPLIDASELHTEADWIAAGKRVFDELDTPATRSDDPVVLAHFTSAAAVDRYRDASHDVVSKDGVLLDYRWVVTADRKLKLSLSSCAGCHTRLMPDGSVLAGAPSNFDLADSPATAILLRPLRLLPEQSRGQELYLQCGVPWRQDDVHRHFRSMPDRELQAFSAQDTGAPPGTTFVRFGGSPYFETRMADLRGVRDRRYLDATGTHQNRGPADIARYGILVEYAEATDFGPHHLLPGGARPPAVRPPDAAMLAMAKYLCSLDPAPSPHPFDAEAQRGRDVFESEGCAKCHRPPLYTDNLLVPVPGFDPPTDAASTASLHISKRRVDTDPGLALQTRKGTGYYKTPSLRGLWYRGLYGHSGDVASLSDWFDERRLRADYVPTGWRGPGVEARAVPGHEFGLDLDAADKRALIAFLMTL